MRLLPALLRPVVPPSCPAPPLPRARPCCAALGAAQKRIRALEGELAGIKEKMAGLKTELYAKFGNAINLEE